jgi:carbon-monoxide dehydrogenase medium subunit
LTPKKFDYYAPATLSEALQILHEKEDSKVLAGGQSLLALMKLRLAAPAALVDITKLQNMSYVREEGDQLAIGALTIHDIIEHDKTVKEKFTLFTDAASKIGDQQIRNRGTIGGSACHADPAADMPTALRTVDAQFIAQSPNGKRTIPSSEFFVDVFTTSLGIDEVLTEIRIPYLPPNSASAYIKHSRREGDFAIVGVGTAVTLGEGNICKDIKIGLAAVGPTPLRASAAEEYLKGKVLDEKNIHDAAERANEGATPPSDVHGSKEYRMEMIKVFTRRSIKLALSRIK